MLTVTVLIALFIVGTASAWTPTRSQLNERRWHVLHMREDKCLRTWDPKPISEVKNLKFSWGWWGGVKEKTRAKSSRCVPTNPTAIVRYVFPSYAEDQALRVAGCESTGIPYHLNPYAKNPYSSASGLFQLLDTWWAGKFDPFNALANTRMAYQLWLSSGGSFAQHWAASAGCW